MYQLDFGARTEDFWDCNPKNDIIVSVAHRTCPGWTIQLQTFRSFYVGKLKNQKNCIEKMRDLRCRGALGLVGKLLAPIGTCATGWFAPTTVKVCLWRQTCELGSYDHNSCTSKRDFHNCDHVTNFWAHNAFFTVHKAKGMILLFDNRLHL